MLQISQTRIVASAPAVNVSYITRVGKVVNNEQAITTLRPKPDFGGDFHPISHEIKQGRMST